MAEGEGLPDKRELLEKAARTVKLLEAGHRGKKELLDLFGEVGTSAEARAAAWESATTAWENPGYNHWQALADAAGRLEGTLIWAKRDPDNKPENLLHKQIPEYIGAVEDAVNEKG